VTGSGEAGRGFAAREISARLMRCSSRARAFRLGTILLLAACGAFARTPPPPVAASLGGTAWRLVKFQGSDDTTLRPDDTAKYTIEFHADGGLTARIDCNRGRATWKSPGPSQLRLGPLALTRAMCPPGSLHDRIVKDWSFVRSYVLKEGHLFLALMADGGIYEFEPIPSASAASVTPPVASSGPITYACTQAGGGTEALSATFYRTEPAMVLVERGGRTRPAFHVTAASGAKYEGQDLMFWDARGQPRWSGRVSSSRAGNADGCQVRWMHRRRRPAPADRSGSLTGPAPLRELAHRPQDPAGEEEHDQHEQEPEG
jgi:heat shock protein HslJ/membrane-bound inhibitor of C-type lysozyme